LETDPNLNHKEHEGSQRKPVIPVHQTPTGVSFAIKVHPRAKKNAITGELGEALKLALTAPPADGRANEACIEFFANLLDVPRPSVTIASGETSRRKVIRVAGLSADEVRRRLIRS
jgi:uncharacterized protein (TIGR00251 family)